MFLMIVVFFRYKLSFWDFTVQVTRLKRYGISYPAGALLISSSALGNGSPSSDHRDGIPNGEGISRIHRRIDV